MNYLDTIELMTFNLKLIGKKRKRNVLISAGKPSDKERLLPSIKKLISLNVKIFATKGTSIFLEERLIPNKEIFKITEKNEPNIKSFLKENRFDLVVNVLTGDYDYDESSDSKTIRALSIKNGIPLITDVDVAIITFEQMIKKQNEGVFNYQINDSSEKWNLKYLFYQMVKEFGGFSCYHAHFDKALLINTENLKLSQADMQKKWELYKYLKESYTVEDLRERMSKTINRLIEQGVTYCRTFVDADNTVKLLPIKTLIELRKEFQDQINIEIAVQPLEGVLDKKSRKFFEQACELADLIGGLPSKDRPMPEKHLDIIMDMAKSMNKKIDVHIDQENNPFENETELLALKTIEHGLEGYVSGVHAISLSAKPPSEQDRIIKLLKEANLNIIVCPAAGISMKQLDLHVPSHNSIAPVGKLIDSGIKVFMGIDNIADLFMPLADADMWFECRLLMESCRFYDLEKVAEIVTDKSGFTINNSL